MLSLPQGQQLGKQPGCSQAQLFLPCSPLCQQTQPVLPPTGSSTYLDFWSGLHSLLAGIQHLDVTHLSFLQLPPCPTFPFHGSPGADQSCKCCPITQTVYIQVPSTRLGSPHSAGCSLEQGWESSLDGYTVAELFLAQVHTGGREGGEDSTEAWLCLQDR